jgi:hypothetical protein
MLKVFKINCVNYLKQLATSEMLCNYGVAVAT